MRHALASASSGLAVTQAESQLRGLALLQKRVDGASAGSLAAMRAEVVASVAATQAFVQQTQGSGSTVTAEKAALQQASDAARGSVTDFLHAYYDEHKFDRFLQFTSTEDEQEYCRRAEERKHAIDKALAEHTPEGNLLAAKLSIEQLKDAGSHGADKSPDYQPTLQGLESNASNLVREIDTSKAAPTVEQAAENKTTAASDDIDLGKAVTPDVLAAVRSAKIVVADQSQEGSGVGARKPSLGPVVTRT